METAQDSIDAMFSQAAGAATAESADPAPHQQPSNHAPDSQREHDVERILGLPVPLSVLLAERDLPVETLLEMSVGTILEFEASFDSELSLRVVDRPIATGQAVKVGERFGIRLTHVGSVQQRVNALRKG